MKNSFSSLELSPSASCVQPYTLSASLHLSSAFYSVLDPAHKEVSCHPSRSIWQNQECGEASWLNPLANVFCLVSVPHSYKGKPRMEIIFFVLLGKYLTHKSQSVIYYKNDQIAWKTSRLIETDTCQKYAWDKYYYLDSIMTTIHMMSQMSPSPT